MNKASKLIKKYRTGKCTPEELALLQRWIHDYEDSISDQALLDAQDLYVKRVKSISKLPNKIINIGKIVTAAILLLALSIGIYVYNFKENQNEIYVEYNSDVAPGKEVAMLTLANGKKIVLDDIKKGKIADNNTSITYGIDGVEINYLTSVSNSKNIIEYHTIETPSKGMYKMTLADGSKVWLNSNTILKFPSQFNSDERKVELSGEAYFEIEKDSRRKFIVNTNSQKVEVLGTHFNIKNYEDEPNTKTTLLEGSVKVVTNNNISRVLHPGEQAILQDEKYLIKKVNAIQHIDWKNGDFIFEEENLVHIMKRVSRWYGVDVLYSKNVDKKQTFSGQVSRSKNLSEVLKCLSLTSNTSFTIKDNSIYIN